MLAETCRLRVRAWWFQIRRSSSICRSKLYRRVRAWTWFQVRQTSLFHRSELGGSKFVELRHISSQLDVSKFDDSLVGRSELSGAKFAYHCSSMG